MVRGFAKEAFRGLGVSGFGFFLGVWGFEIYGVSVLDLGVSGLEV